MSHQSSSSSNPPLLHHPESPDACKTKIRFRVAEEADRAAICQLVVTNHLAISRDCPAEWVEQLRDVCHDYGHLMNADKFALGLYRVAVTTTTTTTTTDNGNTNHRAKERIVGVAGIIPKSGNTRRNNNKKKKSDNKECNTWVVTAVSVDPSFRRCGLAETLLRTVLSEARDDLMQIERLELETLLERMEPAWRLYEKVGFQRVGSTLAFPAGPDRPQPLTVLQYALDL